MEQKTQPVKRRLLVPVLLCAVIALLAVIVVFLLRREPDTVGIQDGAVPKLGYAEGVTVVDDPQALQKAVDEMYAKAAEGNIMLEYANEATSTDGKTFECYIANAVENSYDLYVDIYADQTMQDEIYLSGLIRPGSAFREIELKHALDPGVHEVYAAFTQVEADLETIHSQVVVTMEFTVTGS